MTRDDLQSVLQQPYQRDRWGQTLRGVLPGTELLTVAQPVAAANTQARQIHQLGRIRLAGGRNLAALEIVLDPAVGRAAQGRSSPWPNVVRSAAT